MPTDTPADPASPAGRDDARAFCRRALACVKVGTPDGRGVDAAVARPLVDGLRVTYAVDAGQVFHAVRQRHLDVAGMTRDELHAIAVANLWALVESRVEVHRYGHIFVVTAGSDVEASLLPVDDFWTRQAPLAPDGFVVAIPARDLLAFGDRGSKDALRELDDLCTRAGGSADHPLTDTLFERIDGHWRPLARDTDD